MKHVLISVMCLLLANVEVAVAQNSGNTSNPIQFTTKSSPNSQQALEAQKLLDSYNANYRNSGRPGRDILENIHAKGLAKTAENVKAMRSLVSSKVTNDEKIPMIRILGSLHTYDDKTGMNTAIEGDLKSLVYSGQKDIGRAGALAFSRLGFFNDSTDVLLYAKNNNFIDTDEYFGELAHLVRFAPATSQLDLVSKIRSGKSKYATEILAFIAQDTDAMKKLYPDTKKLVQSCIEENEPSFGQAIGEFGLIDAIRYSTWLNAVATLNSTTSNVKYIDVVLARLNNDKTDPRKIMAFLMSSEGKKLIQDTGKSDQFQSALQRISLYSKQLPQNVIMKDIVRDITVTINSVPIR